MDDSQPSDDVQLGLWQPQTREELWGDLWYIIWLTELSTELPPNSPAVTK